MRIRIGALAAGLGLAALGLGSLAPASVQVPLRWGPGDVRVAPAPDGRVAVFLQGGFSLSDAGQPDLPWVPVEVPLPDPGTAVSGWTWQAGFLEDLAADAVPVPAILDRPYVAGGPTAVPADPAIYSGAEVWPRAAAVYRGVQIRDGRAAASFLVCPFQWDPAGRRLRWSPRGTLAVELGPGRAADAVVPLRTAPRGPGSAWRVVLSEGRGEKLRPGLDTPLVEYVVITTDELAPSFQPLIDWKNRQGIPAAIRTVDWISENYTQGVDAPERIRLFLRDAYALWGTRTVILGGDPALVPIRYARSYWWEGADGGTKIVTDHYYACLDGNWNADGDQIWGEGIGAYNQVNDFVDLTPELRVGRVSALSAAQAATWVAKYLRYVRDPVLSSGYLERVLSLAEVLVPAAWTPSTPDTAVKNDGASDALAMQDTLAASPFGGFFQNVNILERHTYWNTQRPGLNAIYESRASTIAGINDGQNILFHVGHGDRDRLAVGAGRYLASDMMGATNGPEWYGLAFTVNCNSAAVDADCVGEAFQFSPDGGGINYFGSSNLDFPTTARYFQNLFFRRWAADPYCTPGLARMSADSVFARMQGQNEGPMRFLLYSLMMLGDPDLNVWKTTPGNMQVTLPSAYTLGGGPVHVTVRSAGGLPLQNALVCLYKADDVQAMGWTNAGGTVNVPFQPTSPGTFLITATHPLAKPYQGTATVVASSQPYVTLTDYTLTDDGTNGTRGNGNGRIESGETVGINLLYTNRGASTATGVTASLRLPAAVPGLSVVVTDSTETIGDVAPSASDQASNAFLVEFTDAPSIPPGTPTRPVVNLDLVWQAGTGSMTQRITPEANRTAFELIHTRVLELDLNGSVPDSLPTVAGEVIGLTMEIYNQGGGTWSNLRARIVSARPGTVEMQDSLAAFPEIAPGESGVSDTVRFELVNPTALTMNLLVEDMTGIEPRVILSRLLKLRQRPTAPVDLRSTSEPSAVSLGWGGPPNTSYIWGYRVYRAANSAGPYERIGTGYVAGARVYKDENVPDAAEFWYRVAAVDSSGVEGRRSGVAFGVPSPKMLAGWPKDVPDSRDGCPTIENLSGAGDREIVVLSDVVHVFNADGGDYYDGDHNPATIGRFTPDLPNGQNLLGKPAVADLDLDEQLEVIAAATNGYNGNWNPPAALVVLNRYGRVLWERPLLGRPVTSAPAVGNIDGDNEKEIVLITGRYVWAFNHDGTSVNPNFPDGKLLLIPGGDVQESPGVYKVDWQLASVALANIDQDDRDEIVFTTRSGDSAFNKLYIINGVQSVEGQPDTYGTNYNIFPFTYADHVAPGAGTQYSNSSPAVGDFTSKLDMRPDGAPDIALLTYNRLWAIDPTNPGQQLADKLVWAKETQTLWTGGENPLTPSPALGDVDADGAPDVAVGSNNGAIYVFDGSGRPLEGFRQESYLTYLQIGSLGSRMGSPIMADIDGVVEGDGMRHPEVVIGDSEGFVYAVRKGGQMVPGFPYAIPGAKIGIGLTAWDIDRDGYQNLVIQTDKVQAIRVLEFPACPFSPLDADIRAANPWPQFRHDASNSGYYPNDIVTPVLTLNLDGSAADGDRVQIRWRTETAVASFAAARREGLLADWESIGQWPAAELLQEDGSYLLEDRVPAKGEWSYRIEGLDAAGALQLSGEVAVQVGVPAVFRLHPARPNPFNPRTLIRLDLPQTTLCDLRIVDVTGRTVRRLLSGRQPAGSHDLVWDGRSDLGHEVGSGIYFVQAMAVGYSDQKEKLVLLK